MQNLFDEIRISLAQIHIQPGDQAGNMARAVECIREAVSRGSQLLLLPELWSSGYDFFDRAETCRINRDILARFSTISSRENLAIGGSYLVEESGKYFNRFVLILPEEKPITYSKIHLFRLMSEHKWMSPGGEETLAETSWGKTGLAICYDLRFPELFRRYTCGGARLVLLAAEWPLARIEHWRVLLSARAIENQIFIAATNCVGLSGNEAFGGDSVIISPWGEVIVEGNASDEILLTGEIDFNQMDDIRRRYPFLEDRRPDIYG